MCPFSYCFITVLSKRIKLVCNIPFLIGETAQHQPIATDKWFLKNVTTFPKLYYACNYNAVCHKNFMTSHSVVYRLGNHGAIISIARLS